MWGSKDPLIIIPSYVGDCNKPLQWSPQKKPGWLHGMPRLRVSNTAQQKRARHSFSKTCRCWTWALMRHLEETSPNCCREYLPIHFPFGCGHVSPKQSRYIILWSFWVLFSFWKLTFFEPKNHLIEKDNPLNQTPPCLGSKCVFFFSWSTSCDLFFVRGEGRGNTKHFVVTFHQITGILIMVFG